MGYYLTLPDVLRAAGLKVVTLAGWQTRGSSRFSPKGVIAHHTATGPNWTDAKVEALLRDGRPGLSGPLSQLGLRRDGTFVVIAAGRANHAGKGSWGTMSGNTTALGIEAYNSGLGEPWAPEQMDAYVRGTAAILLDLKQPYSNACGHREFAKPAGRKPDPAGIDLDAFRVSVRAAMIGQTSPPPAPKPSLAVAITAPDGHDEGAARVLSAAHGFRFVPLSDLDGYHVDYLIWVGGRAGGRREALFRNGRDGIILAGPGRAETAAAVAAKVTDPNVPRRRPWAS